MSILFAGSPGNAAIVLTRLLESGVDVAVVLTREDSIQGRKKVLAQTDVADVAMRHAIPVIKSNVVDDKVLEELSAYHVNAAIVVAYGVLLKQPAIDAIPGGWFNLHFSMLPKYRGAAPVQRALLAGESETGITLFKIDAGLDTGPIAATLPVEISPDETSNDLLNRLSILGATLIGENLPRIQSGFLTLENQMGEPTYAPKLERKDGFLSFRDTRNETFNRFRAVTSEPGAWALMDTTQIKIHGLKFTSLRQAAEPGTVALVESKVIVQCLDGALEILLVQPSGKGTISAPDWFRGLRGEKKFEAQ